MSAPYGITATIATWSVFASSKKNVFAKYSNMSRKDLFAELKKRGLDDGAGMTPQ